MAKFHTVVFMLLVAALSGVLACYVVARLFVAVVARLEIDAPVALVWLGLAELPLDPEGARRPRPRPSAERAATGARAGA